MGMPRIVFFYSTLISLVKIARGSNIFSQCTSKLTRFAQSRHVGFFELLRYYKDMTKLVYCVKKELLLPVELLLQHPRHFYVIFRLS